MLSTPVQQMIRRVQRRIGPYTRRFFRDSYRWIDAEGGAGQWVSLGPLEGQPAGAIVLPRTRVFFTHFNLADVPKRQRLETLRLELEQHAPFDEPRGWVQWQGQTACVWYWPQALEAELREHSDGSLPLLAMPETALWPRLMPGQVRRIQRPDEGLYLLQACPNAGSLQEKRYTRAPGDAEVASWLSRHGFEARVPQPTEPGGSEPVGETLHPVGSALEQRVLPGAAAVLVFLVAVYLVANGRAWWSLGQTEQRHERLQAEVQSVVDQREQAQRIAALNRQLADLRQPPQLLMARQLVETLDVGQARLIEWHYRDGRLELTWRPETSPDATELIRRTEKLPAFEGVQAQIQSDGAVEMVLQVTDEALMLPARAEAGDA